MKEKAIIPKNHEEQKIIILRKAMDEGVNSVVLEDFNPEEYLIILYSKKTNSLFQI